MSPPFVLVHGAWHSAASWRPLVDELTARGERAVAVDLPGDDPAATLEDYAQAIVDGAAGFDEPVVLVGHSLAGISVPLVPARRPVAGVVLIAAAVPLPGVPAAEGFDGAGAFADGFLDLAAAHQLAEEDGASRWTPEGATAAFYHDVPEELLAEALAALRLQCWGPVREPWPLAAYPDVPLRFIACEDDRIISGTWQMATATTRLGVDPDLLPGSHSPMLARPTAVADLLQRPF